MAAIKSLLDESARGVVGKALQGALVDLIDLSLQAKQAHWNLIGHHFPGPHSQLDDVVSSARARADAVAERAMALGLGAIVERMRERVRATDAPDPVSQGILIEITAEVEKHHWMFQAQR